MTAEIAIINKGAVTLATDSAVTLTVRGSEKIYNSADKLFEVADDDPIGIMVYNNLEYMGVSLELAIKKFRSQGGKFATVSHAASSFFEFLLKDLPPDEALQRQHARTLVRPMLAEVRHSFERAVAREIKRARDRRKPELTSLFTRVVQRRLAELHKSPIADCFAEVSEDDLARFYSETTDSLVAEIFSDMLLDDEQIDPLRKLAILSLHRQVISDYFTGLVFAGFGQDETFPSLVAFKTDGVIFGKIKKIETDRVSTNRSEVAGHILPFAQREMVDRFMYGIDPIFESAIERYLQAAMEETGAAITLALPKRQSRSTRNRLAKSIQVATGASIATWRERIAPFFKDRFMREVQDMIFLMPKQELALLAQELINLTSVKRKFSSGRESVGGPIDVAVISRIDGFVWVRRKHYFEPELNPRYFHRKFGKANL